MLAAMTDTISPMPIMNAVQLMTWNARTMRFAILLPINNSCAEASTFQANRANENRAWSGRSLRECP